MARLVVCAREGRPPPGHGAGAGPQEAPRHVGEGPDALLRRRRAHQARRLLPAGCPPRERAGLRAGPLHALLERLAGPEVAAAALAALTPIREKHRADARPGAGRPALPQRTARTRAVADPTLAPMKQRLSLLLPV